jgi:glycosyltransferase involved in cell wall biosynthesis
MKILVPLHGFISWTGGLDLIRLVIMALRTVADARGVHLVLAMPEVWPGQSDELNRLRAMAQEFSAGSEVRDCGLDARSINRLAIEIGADMVFPSFVPIRGSHVRKIGYVYDLQHRDLPELFSAEERARRDEAFSALAQSSDAIFTTSRFVAQSVQRQYGVPATRTLVFPYTPYAQAAWFSTDPAEAQARHGTGARYAMVCNHFWIHKDHATALAAFAQVVQDPAHADLNLVMTGATADFRDPNHFEQLRAQMRALGIESRCRILGLIPKLEQIALLREARVLIQPTRYEGGPGGGASYEAIGLGIPLVLSDIAVNQEVAGEDVFWFRVGNADDLADKLRHALALPRRDLDLETVLTRAHERLAHSGNTILDSLTRLALPRVG